VASTDRPITFRVALGLTVVAALALSGCGRKGPLEAPPSAQAVTTDQSADTGTPPSGPVKPKRHFFLDPLL